MSRVRPELGPVKAEWREVRPRPAQSLRCLDLSPTIRQVALDRLEVMAEDVVWWSERLVTFLARPFVWLAKAVARR